MKRFAFVFAALLVVSACANSDDGSKMRFSDAYMSCQQIADEFAEMKNLRTNRPVKKPAQKVKTAKHVLTASVNMANQKIKKYQSLKAAENREPTLHKLARIRDCNFTPQ